MENYTYQYKKPFRFMGAEYTDSRSLADAFVENWDIAAAVFCRGGMEGFWREYVQEADGQAISLLEADASFHQKYRQIWDNLGREDWLDDTDVLFPVILHEIEPALGKIPFIRAEDDGAKLYSFEEFGDWLLSIAAGNKWMIYEKRNYSDQEFDVHTLNRTLVEYAAKHRIFSAYVPGVKKAEENFRKADEKQKCRCLEELALKIGKKEGFWYHDVCYNSIEGLGKMVQERLRERAYMPLFRDLFDNSEYKDAFDAWFAKVDGGRHQKEMSELKKEWFNLNESLPDGKDLGHIAIEYSTYGSLMEKLPYRYPQVKSFLPDKLREALAKALSIKEELLYRRSEAAVFLKVILVGFLSPEDMEKSGCLKNVKDRIERLEAYLENEKRYIDEINLAIACVDEGQQAEDLWRKAAEQGYAEAKYRLGFMYEVAKNDYEKALEWYKKAAEQGHAVSQWNLGVMYERGRGVAKDYEQAVEWYKKAAEQGNARKQCILGSKYEFGKGAAQDNEKAAEWYKKSAEQGYAEAQCCLGVMYEFGKGVAQDYEKAVEWYKKSAEQGYARGQCNLGVMYEFGRGVAKDYEKAVEWHKKSAEQGHARGQCRLGDRYLFGEGVAQDFEQAVEWYKKAADQGDASGQCHMGIMYERGHGVAQDYEQAVEWYKKSAEQGYALAQGFLGLKYQFGQGVAQDYEKAVEWYKKSAEQGYAAAQCDLGNMYEDGHGVAQDYEKAAEWYKKAADHGEACGRIYLERLLKK